MNTIFNPLVYLGLTVLSLILGLSAIGSTESVLVFLPALIFIGLFSFSLLLPVNKKSPTSTPFHPEPVAIRKYIQKLTMSRLVKFARH